MAKYLAEMTADEKAMGLHDDISVSLVIVHITAATHGGHAAAMCCMLIGWIITDLHFRRHIDT